MHVFSPLDRHYDNRFGAVADSFKDAATELETSYDRVEINGHLPIAYLYRHSIELYLKGLIIIIHKRLKLPYGSEPYFSEPQIPEENGKPKTIYSIHDISVLYKYVSNLFFEKKINEVTGLNDAFGPETRSKVERIKDVDPKSQFFRYPTNRSNKHEKEKSVFKETTYKEVMASAMKKNTPVSLTRTEKPLGRDVQFFVHDDSFTAGLVGDLSDLAEEVSVCHFALIRTLGSGS